MRYSARVNCMGYALGIQKWLGMHTWGWDVPRAMPLELEERFELKPVRKQDMVLGKEYIAFRWGKDDFHFMKRGKNGHWRHKMGWCHATSISQKEVFAPQWYDGKYTSKIYLFELQ